MLKQQISPSMMCADYRGFTELLKTFEDTGIEYLHIDIMDGVFVKNFTLGTDYCERLRALTNIPLDIHLMITEPEWKIDWFKPRAGEYVSVHAESTNHLQRTLAAIRKYDAKPMVALNPATPLSVLDYVLDDIDAVLIMTVNPGFAGQKLIPQTLKRLPIAVAISTNAATLILKLKWMATSASKMQRKCTMRVQISTLQVRPVYSGTAMIFPQILQSFVK